MPVFTTHLYNEAKAFTGAHNLDGGAPMWKAMVAVFGGHSDYKADDLGLPTELLASWEEKFQSTHKVFCEWRSKVQESVRGRFLATYAKGDDDEEQSYLWIADKDYDYKLVMNLNSLLFHQIGFYLSRNLASLMAEKKVSDWTIDWVLKTLGVEFGGDDCCLGKFIRIIKQKFIAKDRVANGLFVDVPDRWRVVRQGTVKKTMMSFVPMKSGFNFAVRATMEKGKKFSYLLVSDVVLLPKTRFPSKWGKWTDVSEPTMPKDTEGDEPFAGLDGYLDYDAIPAGSANGKKQKATKKNAIGINMDDLDNDDDELPYSTNFAKPY